MSVLGKYCSTHPGIAGEAGDLVVGRPPGRLPDAPAGPGLRRVVYPDVHEHHDARGDIERAQGRVQHVAYLLAQLKRGTSTLISWESICSPARYQ